jgi:hypothetical protein
MSRPKPLPTDVLNNLIARTNVLLKNGIITKDFIINTEEAAIITGLSPETVRQYAKTGYLPAFKYPGKNLYPLAEICQWVLCHYSAKTLDDTREINGYKPGAVKRGRPRKK